MLYACKHVQSPEEVVRCSGLSLSALFHGGSVWLVASKLQVYRVAGSHSPLLKFFTLAWRTLLPTEPSYPRGPAFCLLPFPCPMWVSNQLAWVTPWYCHFASSRFDMSTGWEREVNIYLWMTGKGGTLLLVAIWLWTRAHKSACLFFLLCSLST